MIQKGYEALWITEKMLDFYIWNDIQDCHGDKTAEISEIPHAL